MIESPDEIKCKDVFLRYFMENYFY